MQSHFMFQRRPNTIAPLALRDRYERVLRRRLLTPLDARKVKIRDILITEEFSADAKDFPMGLFKSTCKALASRSTMMGRIGYVLTQFDIIAKIALQYHLNDNYENPDKYLHPDEIMEVIESVAKNKDDPAEIQFLKSKAETQPEYARVKPKCAHNVTRITTSEFFFYNTEHEGPWEAAEFGFLSTLIEREATQFPIGIHLILATFPVANTDGIVENLALHIQCGPHPRIDATTKLMRAVEDPSYPLYGYRSNNSNATTFQAIKDYPEQLKKLNKLLSEIKKGLANGGDFAYAIEEVKKLCQANGPHYPINHEFTLFIQDATQKFDATRNLAIKISLAEEFIRLFKHYMAGIRQVAFVHTPKANPITTLAPNGVRYTTLIELCIDHEHKVAEVATAQAFKSHQVLPTYVSQVLASNTYSADADAALSETSQITQADPLHAGLYSEAKVYNSDKVFLDDAKCETSYSGIMQDQRVNVVVYPPKALKPFKKVHLDAIHQHNNRILEDAVDRILDENQPVRIKSEPLPPKKKLATANHFFTATAKAQVHHLQHSGIISAEQAKNILNCPEFVRLLNVNLLKLFDFVLINKYARALFNEPEAHTHIFKLLFPMNAAAFGKMRDAEKIALFKTPYIPAPDVKQVTKYVLPRLNHTSAP